MASFRRAAPGKPMLRGSNGARPLATGNGFAILRERQLAANGACG